MASSPTIRTVSFRIAEDKVAALDLIAKAMDRDRSYLLNEAVEGYLQEQQRFSALVEQGRTDLTEGRFFSHDQVENKVREWELAGR